MEGLVYNYYLRIETEGGQKHWGFVIEGGYDILPEDIRVSNEEYNRLFELQETGTSFRLKAQPTGTGLFDYVEEYTPEPLAPAPPTELQLLQEEVLNQSEMMLDMDFRLTSVELGL